ncbi:MAG: hypothetical protein C5B54_05095 [Acidobacteria bacterium]|nr:MAG: hypothetical protein C5B54_05095 [Acidobacteriota bacterium]
MGATIRRMGVWAAWRPPYGPPPIGVIVPTVDVTTTLFSVTVGHAAPWQVGLATILSTTTLFPAVVTPPGALQTIGLPWIGPLGRVSAPHVGLGRFSRTAVADSVTSQAQIVGEALVWTVRVKADPVVWAAMVVTDPVESEP